MQYIQLALILNHCGAHKRAPLFPRSLVRCNSGRTDLLTSSGRICDVHYTCFRGKVRSINVPLCSLNRNSVVSCCSQYSYVYLLLQYLQCLKPCNKNSQEFLQNPQFLDCGFGCCPVCNEVNSTWTIQQEQTACEKKFVAVIFSFVCKMERISISNRTKAKVIRRRKKDGDWYIYP